MIVCAADQAILRERRRQARSAACGDGLRARLGEWMIVFSERKIEFPPDGNQRASQLFDRRRSCAGCNPQSLGASGDRGIVDRLNVDSVPWRGA